MNQYNPNNELIVKYIKELKLPTVKDRDRKSVV